MDYDLSWRGGSRLCIKSESNGRRTERLYGSADKGRGEEVMTEKNKTEKNKHNSVKPMLEIKDLRVLFPVHKKWFPAVDGVSLKVNSGEITGVVGESGSGKSVMSQSILRLRDHDTAVRYEGEIIFEEENLLAKPLGDMRDIRGNKISIIFQIR